MDVIIGIDPGLKGAIAILEMQTGRLIEVIDMPVCKKKLKSGKTKSKVDGLQLAARLQKYASDDDLCQVWIEQVGSRPGEGHVGAFAFGEGFGIIQGVFAGMGIEPNLCTPQHWKSHLSLTSKTKEETTAKAQSLYPDAALYSTRKNREGGYNALDGRGDALLIAHYARNTLKH